MEIGPPECAGCGQSVAQVPQGSPCPNCGDSRRIVSAVGTATARGEASAQSAVKRGETFWGCAHWLFALLLAVEAFVASELPLPGWAKIIVFLCVSGITAAAIYDSPTTHNLIARLKGMIEDKFR